MVGLAIKWLLLGYGTDGYNPQYNIYELVKDKVYPNVIPQDAHGLFNQSNYTTLVVYNIEKTDPDKVKGMRALDNRVSIEIDVIDKSYAKVNQVSTPIINQLHRYTNNYNSNDDDSIGYGTTEGDNKYGRFAPASTGDTQYVGGLQIKYLSFDNCIESYDEKLEVYRNTLTFDMMYVDDLTIWGADVMLKFDDLNLMATNVGATDDPLYTQPLSLNQGVNYLFSPSVLAVDNSNIESTTLDGIYENFYDTSGTSNTNRPTIKVSANDPPKYNQNNYLEFDTSDYLLSSQATDRLDRKYKELTFFSVLELPGSYSADKSAAVLFKRDSTSDNTGAIFFLTALTGDPSTTGLIKFSGGGIALVDDGAGGEDIRGFNFFSGIISWPSLGINPNLSFENPFYFAVNFKRDPDDNTRLRGQYEWITSSNFTIYGDTNDYTDWTDTATNNFKEYFFNFECLHSDISSFDTNGAGTTPMDDPINIYDFVMWPEYITMGTNKYLQVKRKIIEKHKMYQRTTN